MAKFPTTNLRRVGSGVLLCLASVSFVGGCSSDVGEAPQDLESADPGTTQEAVVSDADFCLNSLYTSSGAYNTARGTKCSIPYRYRASEWTGGATQCNAYSDAWGGCWTYASDTYSHTRGFSGYHWGVKGQHHIVSAPNGIDPYLYPMTWPQGQDIIRYMNNLALDFGANNSNDLWYHAMGTAAGGYYKWFRRSGGAQYAPNDLLVYWNAADDAAYMVNHDPWWQGGAANIYTKYANLTYERGVLGMPTSHSFGAAWGISWQRFTNGYITNRSTGYNDMGTSRLFYVGGAPGTIARHVAARYGALFDYPGGPANTYALDYDIASAMTCPTGPCTTAGKQVRVFNPNEPDPLNRYGWVIAKNGATRAYAVTGAFARKWNEDSSWSYTPWNSRLGFPTGDVVPGVEYGEQSFQGGKIFATSTGTWVAPRCQNICNETSSCSWDNWCTSESGQITTCGQYGACNVQAECQAQCASTDGNPIPCDRQCNNYGTPTKCYKMGAVCEGPADGLPNCNSCDFASSCNESCLEIIPVTGGHRVSKCKDFRCNTCADGNTCRTDKTDCGTTCTNATGATVSCESYAATTNDKDLDGVPDALELELARKFYPNLSIRHDSPSGAPSTHNDWQQFYGNTSSPLFSGNPNVQLPFTVHPYNPGADSQMCPEPFQCLEVRYAFLFNTDLGPNGHRGDNEGYSVLVKRKHVGPTRSWDKPWSSAKSDVNAWKAVGRLFSGHTCESIVVSGDTSHIAWRKDGLDGYPTAPDFAFVSDNKHATYHDSARCNLGLYTLDSCTGSRPITDVERLIQVNTLTNAGAQACHPTFDVTINLPNALTNSPPNPSELYTIWAGNNFASPPGQTATETVDMMIKAGFINWDMSLILCPNTVGPTISEVFND